MAELTIRLVIDPDTGKKNVLIAYESESDALPMEHEEEHRALVDKLIEGGALSAAELGDIIIERPEDKPQATDLPQAEEASECEAVASEQ